MTMCDWVTKLCAAALAVVTTGCGLGAEPSPSGQRVEVADFGIVAWVPDGWTVTTISEEPDLGFIQVGLDRFGADAEMRPILVADQPKQPDQTRPQGCSLAWYGPLALTPDESLAALWGDAPDVTLESLDGRTSRASFADWATGDTHHEQYTLDAGDAIVFLWCFSSEPRRDDWYSIARSIQVTSATD
jgi:hypothetical protein